MFGQLFKKLPKLPERKSFVFLNIVVIITSDHVFFYSGMGGVFFYSRNLKYK
jgi:hypothetical protein